MTDKPFILDIPWRAPTDAFWGFADEPHALLLDGASAHPASAWSYIAAAPIDLIQAWPDEMSDPLDAARAALTRLGAGAKPDGLPPFYGGLAGLLSYELGARLDRLPRAAQTPGDAAWPDLSLGLYDCIAAFDHARRRAMVIAWDWAAPHAERKAHLLADKLRAPAPALDLSPWPRPAPTWSTEEYEVKIARAIAYTHAGDCFQANLSQRFNGTLPEGAGPFSLYARLALRSDAPFSGFWRSGDLALVSNSPERLVRLDASKGALVAEARPIKGTRPRGSNPDEDRALANALLSSDKDRAENLMIVDLLRNDLSRVCASGSVRAPELFKLESFANVHHLVSTITGLLRPGMDAFDLIRAIFPGGSVTGAPKIRAAEIIAELEGAARGPYCGSLAWMTPDGAMDASILIRTIGCERTGDTWRTHLRAGGGIVADSNPRNEVQESLDKAAAMLNAFGP